MDCSLLEFLLLGRLGELAIGDFRAKVVEKLGQPTDWIIDRPHEPKEECKIWTYHRLQINFAPNNTVKDLRIIFYGREETLCPEGLLPLRFVDFEPTSLLDLAQFLTFLEEQDISLSEASSWPEHSWIRTAPGVVAKFYKKTVLVEESTGEQRAIRSEFFTLNQITASAPYEVSGVDNILRQPARLQRNTAPTTES